MDLPSLIELYQSYLSNYLNDGAAAWTDSASALGEAAAESDLELSTVLSIHRDVVT